VKDAEIEQTIVTRLYTKFHEYQSVFSKFPQGVWQLIYQQTAKQSRLLKCGITWNLTREKKTRECLKTAGEGDKKIQWFRLVSIYRISINNHSRPLFVSQDNGTENLKGRTTISGPPAMNFLHASSTTKRKISSNCGMKAKW